MVATTVLPAPAPGLPPPPRSPTLSVAEMILPEEPPRSYSPNPYVERPPSPSSLLYAHSNSSSHTLKLAAPPVGRRGPSPAVRSPPISAKSSASQLRSMADVDAAANGEYDGVASSPILGTNALSSPGSGSWQAYQHKQQRRMSNDSGSVRSEDLENMKWPGFDGPGAFDDSGVVLEEEEEEENDSSPTDSHADAERWLENQDNSDDDMFTSAALSRRAEIILANAKKRLNVMEGNLRGARSSLLVSPSLPTMKMASELSHQLAAARERDRKMYAGMGPIPPRDRQYRASPLSTNGSPGHNRVLSETSVPAPFSPTTITRMNSGKRASSAMGTASSPWSPAGGFGIGRFPIRGSRSYEAMRDHRGGDWNYVEERDHTLRSGSRGSRSPPNTLEPLPEDEGEATKQQLKRVSTTGDLRHQMNDLKGRISSLKIRAQEDSLRRRSLQSLRTPSPFTSAEIWYQGADAYKTGSPITADAGVGQMQSSPTRKALYEEQENGMPTPKSKPPTNGQGKGAINGEPKTAFERDITQTLAKTQQRKGNDNAVPEEINDQDEDMDDDAEDENDFVSVEGDNPEAGGESVYEDAVYEMPVAERHEDRVDAFDYEHFFLHSAMGSYTQESRRSSSASSADSVETTRPTTAIHARQESTGSAKRASFHQRSSSKDSVSTMATFATAAEDQSDDEDDEIVDPLGGFLPTHPMVTPYSNAQNPPASTRPDSAINMRANSNGRVSQQSRGGSPHSPNDLASGLQTSKIFSILTDSPSGLKPRLALNEEEKQLIYSLAASFQQVCMGLQSTSGDQYERKEWRRRLDEARRVLNGEALEGDGLPF